MITCDDITLKAMKKMEKGHVSNYDWELKLSIAPRRCSLTNARIPMFTKAYKGQRIIHGPGSPVLLIAWLAPSTYVFQKLKGNI